jgi:hypothetical protein
MSTIIHRWHRFTQISAVICVICGSCLSGLAKADDLTVAQQELKATIEAAQAKRMAELDKLKPDLARVNAAVDKANDMAAEFQAKVAIIHEEWKQAVSTALKAYREREAERRQDYQGSIRDATMHTIAWSDNPQEEIARAQQDTLKETARWEEWARKGAEDYFKAVQDRPHEATKLKDDWHSRYNREWLEHNKRLQDIDKRLRERLQQRR